MVQLQARQLQLLGREEIKRQEGAGERGEEISKWEAR